MAKTQFLDHEIFGLNKNENFERKVFDGEKREKYVFKDIWILVPKILLSKYFQNDLNYAHYSKSQIFVQKFNFDKTPTFSRVFHPLFFDNFSRAIKVANS